MKRLVVLVASACAILQAENIPAASAGNGHYIATAYDQHGETKSGIPAQRHIVAADPRYLPLGSVIKIRGAGRYSGEYVVADTGEKIIGRHLDIFIPNLRACEKFGRRTVRVRVVSIGNDTKSDVKQAVQAVKQDVKQDLHKDVVGNAATEADWTATHPGAPDPAKPVPAPVPK